MVATQWDRQAGQAYLNNSEPKLPANAVRIGYDAMIEELFSKTHSVHRTRFGKVEWVSFGKELFDCTWSQ